MKGERLPTPQAMYDDPNQTWYWIWISLYGKETILAVHQFKAIWYKAAANQPLSIVLVRDPTGKYRDTTYFDTDTSASDEETIQRYSHRWSTEIMYRETKSLLGSDDPQCRNEKSVLRTPMMAYWSYSLVVLWFVCQWRRDAELLIKRALWYLRKTDLTFSDMLATARRSHLAPAISRDPGPHPHCSKIKTPQNSCDRGLTRKAKL